MHAAIRLFRNVETTYPWSVLLFELSLAVCGIGLLNYAFLVLSH